VESIARIILLLLLVAVLVNLGSGGWNGLLAWFRAKFIGE
jgi:hypothetical protein